MGVLHAQQGVLYAPAGVTGGVTTPVLISNYGREQTDCGYVLYMTPLQKPELSL